MWLTTSHTQLATSLQVQRLHFWFVDWRWNTWTCHSFAFFRQETTLYDVSLHPGVEMRTSDIELGVTQWWTSNPSMEMGGGREEEGSRNSHSCLCFRNWNKTSVAMWEKDSTLFTAVFRMNFGDCGWKYTCTTLPTKINFLPYCSSQICESRVLRRSQIFSGGLW